MVKILYATPVGKNSENIKHNFITHFTIICRTNIRIFCHLTKERLIIFLPLLYPYLTA